MNFKEKKIQFMFGKKEFIVLEIYKKVSLNSETLYFIY